jgi:hypothetical protein
MNCGRTASGHSAKEDRQCKDEGYLAMERSLFGHCRSMPILQSFDHSAKAAATTALEMRWEVLEAAGRVVIYSCSN